MAQHIILLGAPGSGKGTIANLLREEAQFQHFAMGDLVRQNIKRKTPEGLLCLKYNSAGVLVPDATINEMVLHKFAEFSEATNVVWDGYPRTLAQAQAFRKMLASRNETIAHVYVLDISLNELQARIAGRLTCLQCGRVYHIINLPPHQAGLCDICHCALVSRADDNATTYAKRYSTYEKETAVLIAYYEAQQLVSKLDATVDPYNIVKRITNDQS